VLAFRVALGGPTLYHRLALEGRAAEGRHSRSIDPPDTTTMCRLHARSAALCLVVAALALGACGQKGDLYLPDDREGQTETAAPGPGEEDRDDIER